MAAIVIIGLSGYGTEQDRRRAHEAGFNHYLTKPIAPKILLELLSRNLAPPN
jgi:CheY-like chemotaxis protein